MLMTLAFKRYKFCLKELCFFFTSKFFRVYSSFYIILLFCHHYVTAEHFVPSLLLHNPYGVKLTGLRLSVRTLLQVTRLWQAI